jgi:hypothetical protein
VLDAFRTLCSWTDSPADSMPQQFGKRNRINALEPSSWLTFPKYTHSEPMFRALLIEAEPEVELALV